MAQRKDVLRNRAAILEAAESVFGLQGADASTEDVAERAGVGIATVFRHFPTKADLIRAVIRARLDFLASAAEKLTAQDGDIVDFMRLVAIAMAEKRLVSDTLREQDRVEASPGLQTRLWSAADILLRRNQEDGLVRRDLDVIDIRAMVAGISGSLDVIGDDHDRLDRLLGMISATLHISGA